MVGNFCSLDLLHCIHIRQPHSIEANCIRLNDKHHCYCCRNSNPLCGPHACTMSSWDFLTKFLIVGNASVGKSSLLVRLTDDRFLVNPETTIGVEFGSHVVHIQETQERIKLTVWDTAGSEVFRSITRSYYRGAAGALLVYSVVDRASFVNIGDWLRDIRQHAEENVTVILVGNKVDLCEDDEPGVEEEAGSGENKSSIGSQDVSSSRKRSRRRQVSTKEAEAYAKQEG